MAALTMQRVRSWHRGACDVWWIYQRTPEPLRRPSVALRVGIAGTTLWFCGLFLSLGLVLTSLTPTPLPLWILHGYFVAAMAGATGLVFLATRRIRVGAGMIGSMFVLGQLLTIAAAL